MALTKILKTPAYFSRYQVKQRRRREGKTDYQARRNLIRQELRKYNVPKYRFVVRFTNAKVVCQVTYATIAGDRVIASANSTELANYGFPVGLTNYAAAYATGLLCARRLLKSVGLDGAHVGQEKADGEEYHIEEEDTERRPFHAYLDIGLIRTTTGNRVFGALKGAVDGGMHIPHSVKRFPGYTNGEDGSDSSYDAKVHRERIFGLHVAKYMAQMKEEDPEKYESHFSRYIKAGITAENYEEKIAAVHAAIRADPSKPAKEQKQVEKAVRDGQQIKCGGVSYTRYRKLTIAERKARVEAKIAEVARLAAAAMDQE